MGIDINAILSFRDPGRGCDGPDSWNGLVPDVGRGFENLVTDLIDRYVVVTRTNAGRTHPCETSAERSANGAIVAVRNVTAMGDWFLGEVAA